MTKLFIAFLLMVLIPLVLVVGPLLSIWALNTLFGLAIPYTLKTWASALILAGLVSSSGVKAST